MDKATPSMEQIEQRFAAWAQTQPDIRAAMVVGSRARTDHPADERVTAWVKTCLSERTEGGRPPDETAEAG